MVIQSNTWNHLTVSKQMINRYQKYSCSIEILCTKEWFQSRLKMYHDLALDNQQWLICHKTQPNLKPNLFCSAVNYVQRIPNNSISLFQKAKYNLLYTQFLYFFCFVFFFFFTSHFIIGDLPVSFYICYWYFDNVKQLAYFLLINQKSCLYILFF